MDGTRIRLLPALVGTLLLVGLPGCSALDGLFAPAAVAPVDDVFAIEVGDCLNDVDVTGEVISVPIVECAEPHDSEAFAATEVEGATFPGDEELAAQLAAFCQGEAFTAFIGVPYADSTYYTGGYYPTAASWASGDRELLCTVHAEGERTTGSLEGVAR